MSAIDMLAGELLEALVRKLETDPTTAHRLRSCLVVSAPEAVGAPTFMRVEDFAARRGFSRRTVDRWIREGMPVIGENASRRVDVERADAWVRSRSNSTDVSEAEAAERGSAAALLKVVR